MERQRPDLSFEHQYWNLGSRSVGVDEVGRGCLAGPVVVAAVCLPDWLMRSDVISMRIDQTCCTTNSKELNAAHKLRISNAGNNNKNKSIKSSTNEINTSKEIMIPQGLEQNWWTFLNDSKKLTPSLREKLSILIWKNAHVQVAWCFPHEIDRWNILCASMIAMRQALWPFAGLAQAVLVDGPFNPYDLKFHAKPGESQRLGFKKIDPLVKGDGRSLSIAAASIVAKVYRDEWMENLDSFFPGYQFKTHKGYSTAAHYHAIEKLGPCEIHRKSFAPFKASWIGS